MGKGKEWSGKVSHVCCHVVAGRAASVLGPVRELMLFLFCPFHNLEAPFPLSPCKKEKLY